MQCPDEVLPARPPPAAIPPPRPLLRARRAEARRPAAPADAPDWLWRGTVPCLDGLRAVSIGIVILAHLAFRATPGSPAAWLRNAGGLGVEMFFVLSGFLITLLLLREHRARGDISLRAFYLRRLFRIVPAYAFYLLALMLFQLCGLLSLPFSAWLRPLTYTTSLFPLPAWDVSHTWSLSVEEHFYLAWPLLLVLLGPGRAFAAALLCVLATPAVRAALAWWLGDAAPDFQFFTPTRLDAIAAGCGVAFLAASPGFRRRARSLSGPAATPLLLAGGCSLLVLWALFGHPEYFGADPWAVQHYVKHFIVDSVRPLILAALIWICVTNPARWFGKLLSARPVAFIGRLSFSLYLWQQFFLNPYREHWACRWPVNLGLMFGAALLSYALIETPFLRLKQRFKA
jgi:peptidoglycan/LPS O-acetylase OafA/YrhL